MYDHEHEKRKEEILQFLRFLHPEQKTVEMRIKGAAQNKSQHWQGYAGGKSMINGYFRNYEELARRAVLVDTEAEPEAIYVLLNQCQDELYARCADGLMAAGKATSDSDIIAYKNLLIDIDPVRPSGISSSDEEHDRALEMAEIIREDLHKQGWPDPLVGDSGNGAHLIYKIDLECTRENTDLVKRVLQSLAERYNSCEIAIDTSVYNPSRITKLLGTHARKGSNLTERPYRLSRVICVPENPRVVPIDLLRQLAAIQPQKVSQETLEESGPEIEQNFNLRAYLEHYGVTVVKVVPHGNSTLYCLDRCVFDPSHTGNEASIGQKKSGELFYQCFHNSCKDKTWQDARRRISGSDSLAPFMKKIAFNPYPVFESQHNICRVFSALELKDEQSSLSQHVVQHLVPPGVTLLCGKPKQGKSFAALGIALSVVTGEKVFGYFEVEQGSVLYLALEDTRIRIKERMIKIMGHEDFPKDLHFATRWNRIDHGGLEMLADEIKKIENLRLVIIDTLGKIQSLKTSRNLYQGDYTTISNLKHVADVLCVPFLIIHHLRKSSAEDMFDTVNGTSGLTGAADTIMILSRKRNCSDAELLITGRDVDEKSYALRFDDSNCTWQYLGDPETVTKNNAYSEIEEVIKEMGGEMKVKDIVAYFAAKGEKENTVRWRLSEMLKAGLLYSDERGVYKLKGN